ncbi:glycosyltransferase [Thauera sinica]|uniref:Glycosyltransferase n=1 Tax=Thauera sinica TaxID=2665146 RepID=A0ABW1AW80_9RHOO|nr:glycosyltransferase [Thauera sp. K11]ATE60458.1 glycosyl transferase family 1 [Thauera sp. K11]
MKRVLMVSDVYFPRVNGVSTSIATFRHALRACGIDVRLLAPDYGEDVDQPAEPGVVRVPGRRVPRDPEDRLASWRRMRAAALREAASCDLVHIQTPFVAHYAGVAAARRLKLPLLLSYHTFFEEYLHHYAPFLPPGPLRALARRVSRSQCNTVDGVVVPSTAMRDRLAAYGVSSALHVLPTGIPIETFGAGDGQRFRRAYGIAATAPVALFIGRVAHEKNIGFLIDVAAIAAAALPGFVLVVAGEGPALAELERDAARRGLASAVRFVGYLDRGRELHDCYAGADAFVFASRTETQGLVLLEAMASGLPVVALAEMGTRDILTPHSGAIVSTDDRDAFASELIGLLASPSRRQALSAQALLHSRQWADGIMAERLADLYRRLTSGTAAAAPPGGIRSGTELGDGHME